MEPSELHAAAINAVADARVTNPIVATRLIAIRNLRDATGLGLQDCIPLVTWAMNRPATALTREVKERAVEKMAILYGAAASAYAVATDPAHCDKYALTLNRRRAALVRIAMATTVN